jgi:uncharacterized membrane protein YkvA (DUF1232 family)
MDHVHQAKGQTCHMIKWPSTLWMARKRVLVMFRVLRDGRVPLWKKVVPFLPLIYVISPFNFLTLAIPIIGQIDDLMIIVLALNLFEYLIDDRILAEHQR